MATKKKAAKKPAKKKAPKKDDFTLSQEKLNQQKIATFLQGYKKLEQVTGVTFNIQLVPTVIPPAPDVSPETPKKKPAKK